MKLSIQQIKGIVTEEITKSHDVSYPKIWFNISQAGGLRLTEIGFKILKIEYESYLFKCCPKRGFLTAGKSLALDHNLTCPYFISMKPDYGFNITLFGNKEAMMVNLSGDFDSYLATFRPFA